MCLIGLAVVSNSKTAPEADLLPALSGYLESELLIILRGRELR